MSSTEADSRPRQAIGISASPKNRGTLEKAAAVANLASTRTTQLRRLVVADQTMPAKAISAKLDETGWPNVKMSTITTIRADALATLREAAALGLFVTAAEQKPEPTPARPRRSRSRRQAPVTEAETASA